METLTDLECLSLCREMARETRALRRTLDSLEERLGPAGLRGSCAPGHLPGTNEPRYAAEQHRDAYLRQLEENEQRLAAIRPRLRQILRLAPNSRNRAILENYYAYGETCESIAETTGLSPRHVQRIRAEFTHRLEAAA